MHSHPLCPPPVAASRAPHPPARLPRLVISPPPLPARKQHAHPPTRPPPTSSSRRPADALEKAIAQCDSTYTPGVSFLQVNQRICLPPTFAACQYVRTAGECFFS